MRTTDENEHESVAPIFVYARRGLLKNCVQFDAPDGSIARQIMKRSNCCLRGEVCSALVVVSLFLGGSLWAQPSANDMIVEHFFPPELLRQCQKVLNLTDEQKAFVQRESQRTLERAAELQAQIRKEAEALVPLVSQERVDEQKVLEQSERIRSLESELKRLQFTLLIRLKNQLTPEQQSVLKGLMARNAVIQEKLRKAQALALQREQEGRNLSVLEPMKGEFESLMHEGKFKEAEAVVDRTIRILESLK